MANSKTMRHSTIGFRVSGNIEQLEKANKLLDQMPKKAEQLSQQFKKAGEMFDKAFGGSEGSKNFDKMAKEFDKATEAAKQSANKIDRAKAAYNKLSHLTPKIKVDSNVPQTTQRDESKVKTFSDKVKHFFKSAGTSASEALGGGFDRANEKLKNLNNTGDRSQHLFTKILGSTMISNAVLNSWSALTGKIKEAAHEGVEYLKDQQVMLASWTTLTGNANKARSMRKQINAYSVETGQDTDLVNEEEQGFYHLHSNRKESDTMTHALLNMTDAVGLGKEQANSVAQDMVHTLSGGVVQTGDLNVIGQYFPMFNEALEKYEAKVKHVKSVSGKQLREMAKSGKISAEAYEKVFEQLGNVKYGKAAEQMLGTITGMERTIKARTPALAAAFLQPFQKMANPVYKSVSKWVSSKSAESMMKNWGKSLNLAISAGMRIGSDSFKVFGAIVSDVGDTVKQFSTVFGAQMKESFGSGSGLKHVDNWADSFKRFNRNLKPVTSSLGGLLGEVASGAWKGFSSLIGGLSDGLKGMNGISFDPNKLSKSLDDIHVAFTNLGDAIQPVTHGLGEIAGTIGKDVWNDFKSILDKVGWVVGKISGHVPSSTTFIEKFGDFLDHLAKNKIAMQTISWAIVAMLGAKVASGGLGLAVGLIDKIVMGYSKLTTLRGVGGIFSKLFSWSGTKGLSTKLKSLAALPKTLAQLTPKFLTTRVSKIAKGSWSIGKKMGSEIWSGLKSTGGAIGRAAKSLGSLVKGNFLYAMGGIKSGARKLLTAVSSLDSSGGLKAKGGWRNNLTSRNLSKMGTMGKAATGAVGIGLAASTGIDIYKGIKDKNPKSKFKDFGSGIGTALGGGIGFFFGGPAGAAIGGMIGKTVGKWAGNSARKFTDGWNKAGKGKNAKPPKGLLPKAGYYARKGGDAVWSWGKSMIKGAKKHKSEIMLGLLNPVAGVTAWFLKDTKTGKNVSKWVTKWVKKLKNIKIPNPFKNFHPIKWFESTISKFHPIKWLDSKLAGIGKIKISNPFKNFHPIKWFKDTTAGWHPIKWFEGLFSGLGNIKFQNPFKNFHPIKWFENTLSGFHPIKMIQDAFSGGSKSVRKVIKAMGFATGTRGRYPNGVPHDMMARVNDGGAKELIIPPASQPVIAKGMNRTVFIRKGTHILNGADTNRVMNPMRFATGTAPLATIGTTVTAKAKTGISGTEKRYDKELNGSKKSIALFKRASKSNFGSIKRDTTSKVNSTTGKVMTGYRKMAANVTGQAKGLATGINRRTNSLSSDVRGETTSLYSALNRKTATMSSNMSHKVRNMASNLSDITNSIGKTWRRNWSNMVDYFGNTLTKLKPLAHKGMSGAVSALNGGLSSIDKALSQFGGNNSVLKPIHYATGTKGPIPTDQLAVLNDAKTGPRQELVLRGSKLLKPEGNDVMTHLKKGDHVLNGYQSQNFLPHYAKGTLSNDALIDLATKNSGNPKKAFNTEFDKHVGKGGSSVLSKGILKTAKGAVDSLGTAWSSAMWGLINNTIQGGSGNGSLKPHFGGKFSESSGYGRRTGDVSDFHKGIDFAAPMGTPIPAQYAGTVVTAGSASGFGNWVVIRPTGQDINTIYGHMERYRVHAGQHVRAGQIIANVGAEGEATGPHVHYELRRGLGSGDYRPDPDTYKGKVAKKTSGKGLNGLVKRELGSKALHWIEDNLQDSISDISMSGDVAQRARVLAKAIKRMYPSATNAGIAAVLGNWSFESGLNPNAINPGGGASGLGQWLGGRKTNLINYASSKGKSWKTAGAQLAFALNGEGSDSALLKSVLRGDGSVASLATRFSEGWERGGYTGQHVAGARKIEAALHNAGGWSVPGKLNIFGEKDSEVAINPKQPSADGLIADAIDKRSKVNGSGLAGMLKRAVVNQTNKAKRNSLYKEAMAGLRAVTTSKGSQGSGVIPPIVISPTFNFKGSPESKSAKEFADYTIAEMRKIVQQEIQKHEKLTLAGYEQG